MMDNELKPCPFCGSKAQRSENDRWVNCSNLTCDLNIHIMRTDKWNTRAEDRAEPAWQDIATAPKDGTEIIGYCAKWNKKSEIIYWPVHSLYNDWTDGCCIFDGIYDSDGDVFHKPTHWQPLPSAPVSRS